MSKNCKGCKYHIFKKCRAKHILSFLFPFKCKYFEKPQPYVEKFTKCDKFEYLNDCIENSEVIDAATCEDSHSHYICGLGCKCKKRSVEVSDHE